MHRVSKPLRALRCPGQVAECPPRPPHLHAHHGMLRAAAGVDFSSVNVLDHPQIREGVKTFSEWPTIPQLYVNGEFVGGCDIVTDLHNDGELEAVLAEAVPKQEQAQR